MSESTTTPGLHGQQYQAALVMVLIIRGVAKKLQKFVIETEVKEAGKFDDVVFNEGNNIYTFIQLKHKQTDKPLTESELFNGIKGDYSLIKYVSSYKQIKESDCYKDKCIKNVILFTNNVLMLKSRSTVQNHKGPEKWYLSEGPIVPNKINIDYDDILKFNNQESVHHKFGSSTVVNVLLTQKRKLLLDKKLRITEEDRARLENLTKEDIEDCLKNLIYAMEQPDHLCLFKIINDEMKELFKFHSVDLVFNELQTRTNYWLSTKKRFFPNVDDTIQDKITYDDAKKYLDQYIKLVFFNVTSPIDSFVGRKKELNVIYELLRKKRQVLISGLGGIGKTQLTRKYVQEYKINCYYGRVIWINAENEQTVEGSLKKLCKKIDVNLFRLDEKSKTLNEHLKSKFKLTYIEKTIEEILEEVVQYFKDVIVLFVFDNLDTLKKDNVEKYLEQFRNEIKKSSAEIHIIITSRNRKYNNRHFGLIDLDVLNENDAIELIRTQLKNVQDVTEADATELSRKLQCFPLTLQQAIGYIKQTDNTKQLFGERYTIKQYIEGFDKNKEVKHFLEFMPKPEFLTDLFETTYVIWKITLNGIKEEENGLAALKIIHIIAYLHVENITASIFLQFFNQNQSKIASSLQLLEKYSMIRRTSATHFQTHRLVQKVIQLQLKEDPEEERNIIGLAIQAAMGDLENHDLNQKLNFQSICGFVFKEDNLIEKHAKSEFGYYATRLAAINQNHDIVKAFLKNGVQMKNICSCSFCKNTVLHITALNGSMEMVKFLENEGFDIFFENNKGELAIHSAAIGGHTDIIKFLVTMGVQLNTTNNEGSTILHLAALKGHFDLVKYLVHEGMNTHAKDNYGYSVAHYAAIGGHIDIIDFFVRKKIDLNIKENEGGTILHAAALKGHLNLLKYLLDSGMDIHIKDKYGSPAIHYAAIGGHISLIKYFVDNGVNLAVEDNFGRTILHVAAEADHLNLVKYLIDKGMHIESKIKDCSMGIHYAAIEGNHTIIDFFVKNGVSLDVKTNDGNTALHLAAESGHHNLVQYLLGKGNNDVIEKDDESVVTLRSAPDGRKDSIDILTESIDQLSKQDNNNSKALHLAAKVGRLDLLAELVNKGMDVHSRSDEGSLAIHDAAIAGHTDIVDFFTKSGVELNVKNNIGKTILHLAAENGQLDTVKYLIEDGMDMYCKDRDGSLAMHVAAIRGKTEVIEFFFRTGLDLNMQNNYGNTVLHLAAENGHFDTVKYLVGQGIDIYCKNNDEGSVLHHACNGLHMNIVDFLMTSGLDLNDTNKYGQTALHIVTKYGVLHSVKHLIGRGINIYLKDNSGLLPIHTAGHLGFTNLVDFFIQSGVEMHVGSRIGETVLHIASQNNQLDVVKYLIDKGMDLNCKTNDGSLAIHYAATGGHIRIINLFVSKGIQLKTPNNFGNTVLEIATMSNRLNLVKYLLSNGMDICNKNTNGITAIHYAAIQGHIRMVDFYIQNGVDMNIKDNDDNTILHYAVTNDHFELVKYLIKNGVDKSMQNNEGELAIHIALKNNYKYMIDFLNS